MITMYLAEVLGKLPVIKHSMFGSILAWESEFLKRDKLQCGHDHWKPGVREAEGRSDCCGIMMPPKYPSSSSGHQGSTGLRLQSSPTWVRIHP